MSVSDKPVNVEVIPAPKLDWKYDVKISNDNAKNEKRVTIHARGDCCLDEVVKEAEKIFADTRCDC